MPENVEELMNIKIEIGLSYQISLKAEDKVYLDPSFIKLKGKMSDKNE
jgi:hypothetical protein